MSDHFSAGILRDQLDRLKLSQQTPLLCAVSGGADSLALAHALHRLERPLRLVHVDHQLCPQSAQWAQDILALGADWGVSTEVVKVRIEGDANVEARARAARYAACAEVARPNECLLTAHHLEDQAMTVLLQLLRGAGPAGLAAMPVRRRNRGLVHLRPLLSISEVALADYCKRHDLTPVQDPGNDDPRFDRNFLVHNIAPPLVTRWPAFARTLAHSAAQCADADALLADLARIDTSSDLAGDALDLRRLQDQDPRRMRNALRAWLRTRAVEVPGAARLSEFVRQLRSAAPDASPSLDLDGRVLRAFRGVVYDTDATAAPTQADWCAPLVNDVSLALPGDAGTLHFSGKPPQGGELQVRFRRGGERFGSSPSRSLKTYLHSLGVLPWRRAQVPLVYCDDDIVAVGDWWQSPRLAGALSWSRAATYAP